MNKRVILQSFCSLILLLILLILYACGSADEGQENVTLPENITPEPAAVPEPQICEEGWKCLNDTHQSFQYANCSWVSERRCPEGCVDSSCKEKTCETGFKCRSSVERAFQETDCSWSQETRCEFGCKDSECLKEPEPVNQTANVTAAKKENKLLLGEMKIITVNDNEHNLSIYFLDPDKTKIVLDGQRSDWLEEGEEFNSSSGVIVTVMEILFQGYDGGSRYIIYEAR